LFLPAKVPDFVEGMVYSSSEGVMMTGVYASEQEARRTKGSGRIINRVGWWFKP
jgi:Delta24-sterol reductase